MAEFQAPVPTVVSTEVPAPTAANVYSANNINTAVNTPTAAPNLADPYGLYDQFMNTSDIQAAQANVTGTQAQIYEAQQGLRNTTLGIQDQNALAQGTTGASQNLIGRQVGRASDLTANQLAALSETQAVQQANLDTLTTTASNKYQIAQQERNQLQSLITATGGKAGIKYSDSYEDALNKATDYQEKEAEEKAEEAEKKAYKDSLKAQLRALGSSTKGLSRNELERKLKKKMKSSREYDEMIKDLELKTKQKAYSDSFKTTPTTIDLTKDSNIRGTANELIDEAESKGLFGNNAYEYAKIQGRDEFKLDVASGSVFDNQIRARFEQEPTYRTK
jgi:hypothetical protein